MGNWYSKANKPVDIPKHRPKDYFRYKSTICEVTYKEQFGTGAIYGYEFPERT